MNLMHTSTFPNRAARTGRFLVLAVLSVIAPAAYATPIVDSMGFEAPNFTTTFNGTGTLEGQEPGASLPVGTWQAAIGTTGTAVVQNTVFAPGGGSQAVRVDHASDSANFWGVPVTGFPNPADSVITVSWDMLVEDSGGPAGAFGPYFAVSAFGGNGGGVALLASLGVDATTGDVLYQATGTGFLTESGVVVNFGQWNSFLFSLDFSSQQFSASINGTPPFIVSGFVDGAATSFTDASITSVPAGGDTASRSLTGTAYYDNLLVSGESSQVPEPGSLGLVVLGLIGAATLRRKKS